jgi:hypothetical protein
MFGRRLVVGRKNLLGRHHEVHVHYSDVRIRTSKAQISVEEIGGRREGKELPHVQTHENLRSLSGKGKRATRNCWGQICNDRHQGLHCSNGSDPADTHE